MKFYWLIIVIVGLSVDSCKSNRLNNTSYVQNRIITQAKNQTQNIQNPSKNLNLDLAKSILSRYVSIWTLHEAFCRDFENEASSFYPALVQSLATLRKQINIYFDAPTLIKSKDIAIGLILKKFNSEELLDLYITINNLAYSVIEAGELHQKAGEKLSILLRSEKLSTQEKNATMQKIITNKKDLIVKIHKLLVETEKSDKNLANLFDLISFLITKTRETKK